MAKLALSSIVLVLILHMLRIGQSAVTKYSNPTDYIKASCSATHYPTVCVRCLSGYANSIQQNDQNLAQTALTDCLSRTRSTAYYVGRLMTKTKGLKPLEYQALKDCYVNLASSTNRIDRSINELGRISRDSENQFTWHLSNLETWMSGALTDQITCLDGFARQTMNGGIKVAVKGRVGGLTQVTSNALAFVNRYGSRHKKRGTSATHQP